MMRKNTMVLALLFLLFYPAGVYRVWKRKLQPAWLRWTYTLLGLPLFLVVYAYLFILLFALPLPQVDRTIGERKDKTIVNSVDQYTVTFLKNGKQTNGAYEEVQVELQPGGGNIWHYHTAFVEKFHVVNGELTIGMEGKPIKLQNGQDTIAPKNLMHMFSNTSSKPVTFLVRMEPARSFEKTIRCAYGLMNTGQSTPDGMPKNFWHLCLLLGYSDSYLDGLPGFIQEPLINSLAKIAQWKGADKELEQFFH